jgi:hypothetical protein
MMGTLPLSKFGIPCAFWHGKSQALCEALHGKR